MSDKHKLKVLKPDGVEDWMTLQEISDIAELEVGVPPEPPFPPEPPVDPPDPPITGDPRNWQTFVDRDEWPKEIDGVKVCYLAVDPPEGDERVWLRRLLRTGEEPDKDGNFSHVFTISTVKGLRSGRDTRPSKRVGPRMGSVVMVAKTPKEYSDQPGIYKDVPFSDGCRPEKGDGGNHAFLVMLEQDMNDLALDNINGEGIHPHAPLYLPLGVGGQVVVELYYDPWA